jgi:MSHA biogenesis protein MshQ
VTVRGSGNGRVGYLWHANSGKLTPGVDASGATPAPGHHYRIIVDHSDSIHAWTQVDRNTGSGYVSIIPRYDAKAQAGQAAVPANWQISFTGSTGGNYNIHEIDNLRICARRVYPPSGGTASGFSAIDEAYGDAGGASKPANQQYLTGHLYTKLMGVPFQLNVAAMDPLGNVQSGYGVASTKYLSLKLVDNSDGVCKRNAASSDYCNAACIGKSAVTGGSQVLTFASANAGQVRTGNFTMNTAYKNLVAVMRECTSAACSAFTSTAPACSVDAFAVRPTAVSTLAATATSGVTGVKRFEAGGSFTLMATIAGISANANGYAGTLKIDTAGMNAVSPATVTGNLSGQFAAAVSGVPTATASGDNFTYSEVGSFVLHGYDPASDTTRHRGVYDGVLPGDDNAARGAAWTGVDAVDTAGDCIAGSFANVKNGDGKYGCNFGLVSDVTVGPFVPHHFQTDVQASCGGFTYSGQPFGLLITAQNAGNDTTKNYDKDTGFSRRVTLSDANAAAGTFAPSSLAANEFVQGMANRQYGAGTPTVSFTYSQKQAGPSVVQVRAVDADNVSSQYGLEDRLDNVRSGRLRLANVYGYAAPLAMPLEVQYWSGHSWITNADDACTATALAAGNFAAPGWTVGTISLSAGRGSVLLTPNAPGSITVCLDLGPDSPGGLACSATSAGLPWLQSRWPPGSGGNDPYARATFGVFTPESQRGIYNREIY